ncbi:MAG TPA: hypothetical protein VG672_28685 [Bryobacteraceae bacterium]|nr:hypothetical protein [Bryobacteraceae bacterium]
MQRRVIQAVGVLLVTTALVLTQGAIHKLRGDPDQFTPYVDESSHFVTGLMIHDYVTGGFPGSPIRFAKEYYLHYPKVSFGAWPPLLHILLGGWMLLFTATRHSGILYMDTLTALLVLLSIWLAHRRLPWVISAGVGVAVWLSPVVQRLDQSVQADLQYALFSVLCVCLFAVYLGRPGTLRACGFGLALLAAVMTKNNALFLAISLPLVLVLTRSFGILRRWDAWLATAPALVSVAVWQYLTLPFVRDNMKGVTAESTPGLALFTYLGQLATLAWVGLLPFALWGLYRRLWIPLRKGKVERWEAGFLSLVAGPVLFHCLLPHDVNQRYLLPSLPAILIFAADGFLDLLSLVPFRRIPGSVKAAAAAVVIAAPSIATPVPRAWSSQLAPLAVRLCAEYPPDRYPSILIESSFGMEANLVAEMAVRERRPGHWLLRGSKILRRKTGPRNRDSSLVNIDPADMLRYLKSLPLSLLIVSDETGEEAPDRAYVARMMQSEPGLFTPVLTLPFGAGCQGCSIRVFRLATPPGASFAPAKLPPDMPLWKGL